VTQVATSAPGKIIVAGEYAVLQGAPAICMAVDRRARVSITRSHASTHYVSAPGYIQEEAQFENIAEVADDQPLLAAVWKRFPAASRDSLRIEIDTRSFQRGSEKLGIGSSAAAAVALTAAFAAISEYDGDVGAHAYAVHRTLQDGQGSGADVATGYHGGLIEYRMHKSASARLTWPEGLHYALLWSGRSFSTSAQLQRLAGVESSAAADALLAAAEDVAAAWRTGAAQPILVALRYYTDALHHYDDEYQLDIFSAGHATLTDIAAASGLVYKPSGAGGGDFGIAVADDLRTLQRFVTTAADEGFVHLDLAIDPLGLTVEQDEQ
jgi:phosphomevalonate kinase